MDFSVDLAGRTAIVSGASRGIGLETARALLDNGATVIGLHRGDGIQHPRYRPVTIDLADTDAIVAIVGEIAERETIDILVNNAGTTIRHPFEHFPLEDWDAVTQLNVRSVVALTQTVGRTMLERGAGRIINLASMLSFTGGLNASAYAASKGAIAQFTKSLANEWAGRGVNVNAVAPGYIATDLNQALLADVDRRATILSRIPAGRWGQPSDISGAVLFLASDAAAYVHGVILPVDGGYLAR